MGTDISTIEEVRDANGLWQKAPANHAAYAQFSKDEYFPFGSRSYSVYGFLGNIRNSANSPYITECRGLPTDSVYLNSKSERDWCYGDVARATEIRDDGNNYGYSWVTLAELLAFNYDQEFENLRGEDIRRSPDGNVVSYRGNVELKPGQGEVMTLRKHLEYTYFFEHVKGLLAFGEPENVRVIFWFN